MNKKIIALISVVITITLGISSLWFLNYKKNSYSPANVALFYEKIEDQNLSIEQICNSI